jgi:hypothetical protein
MLQLHLFHRPNVTMPLFTQHIRIRIDCVQVEPFFMLRSPVKVNDFYLPRLGFHHNIRGSQVAVNKPITLSALIARLRPSKTLSCAWSPTANNAPYAGAAQERVPDHDDQVPDSPMTRSHKKSLGATFSFARHSCASSGRKSTKKANSRYWENCLYLCRVRP